MNNSYYKKQYSDYDYDYEAESLIKLGEIAIYISERLSNVVDVLNTVDDKSIKYDRIKGVNLTFSVVDYDDDETLVLDLVGADNVRLAQILWHDSRYIIECHNVVKDRQQFRSVSLAHEYITADRECFINGCRYTLPAFMAKLADIDDRYYDEYL